MTRKSYILDLQKWSVGTYHDERVVLKLRFEKVKTWRLEMWTYMTVVLQLLGK